MGKSRMKRKMAPVVLDDDNPSPKCSRIDEGTEFVEDLHFESAKLLVDLLTDKNLVFVEGSIGCGKTTLVKRVAKQLDLPVKIIHLSDQIDSKTFLGNYQCTEVPGEFIWEASEFSQAITEKCLILLEDLDCASPDLVSSLMLMVKSWGISVRNDGQFTGFHENMRIVATVRSENSHGESSELIRGNPLSIQLTKLTVDELKKIVECKFPKLVKISDKLLKIYADCCEKMNEDNLIDRELNTSDLIRVCKRIDKLTDLNDNNRLFMEFAEVFVLSLSSTKKRFEVAAIIGGHLSIPDDRVNFYLYKKSADIEPGTSIVRFGRTVLPVKKGEHVDSLSTKNFGLTSDARLLMERIAISIENDEPILLTGETGVGKTSVVQLMANYLNISLDVVNMSQDSDSTDLIGGFKPIGTLELLAPFINDVDKLFRSNFDVVKNARFLSHFTKLIETDQFVDYLQLCEATAKKIIVERKKDDLISWADIAVRAQRLIKSLSSRKSALPFSYVEGIVTKAARNGHWLLVDEINLASSECLDAIIHVLDGTIEKHSNFRLFGCMNPATDTGKKKLPVGIRSRFTEFYVSEPMDKEQLSIIVRNYLPGITAQNLTKLLHFYETACKMFPRKYSLRNLCRGLSYASTDLFGNPYKSLYEGISMAFGSDLDNEGTIKFENLLKKHFNDVPKVSLKPPSKKHILVEGSYIEKGDLQPEEDVKYVYSPSIKKNLSKLTRAISSGRFPVLLEGETSAGKTSMIMNLALLTGNRVHRINNHEHTDIQEYIGCYAPDENGKLHFVEGVLLEAVRKGYWVILDELNLAPVEVLEALNRLLDDNRELFVAEKNMVVKAHPKFRLFATQNPVGTYAGRKRLSRAFLNRFIVLRFDHPPFEELSQIVCTRCSIPKTASIAMINVLTELKRMRSQSALFNSTDGLMTLRDLFRWADRLSKSDSGEWRQVLADQGYFLLACRCRNSNDADAVVTALEKHLKVKIYPEKLFGLDSPYMPKEVKQMLEEGNTHIVATFAMRRMLILSSESWKCSEPILMVGETGCGKTTSAQILSEGNLLSINCHERTETSDLLGSIRPNFDGSFYWQDGVVVQAMKNGSKLLIDEISLAADSVLERLNPLLEANRTILLTDAGASAEKVVANEKFQIIATMNPGTDHGKKELSKALRNRFTEIWCNCDYPIEDIRQILSTRMSKHGENIIDDEFGKSINAIVDFFVVFNNKLGTIFRTVFSIRDIIAAADLFVACHKKLNMNVIDALNNCISGVILDSIGILPARISYDAIEVKERCYEMLTTIIDSYEIMIDEKPTFEENPKMKYFGGFPIELGNLPIKQPRLYSFDTPTTMENVTRVARALLLEKPIMLEGNPGAGKSSLIVALAESTGHSLVRLNLSDQTDLADLFGHDIPVTKPDGTITFQWKDGPVLKAIKDGSWILLDEMNLASQSVLEGLNSCFDFRQELFIAELNKKFIIDGTKCRFFACQNPQQQGGNRRALPKSFLNRFTSIYVQPFTTKDYIKIMQMELPGARKSINQMVKFNNCIQEVVKQNNLDFEFNMRDLLRWANFIKQFSDEIMGAEILYVSRFPLHLQSTIRAIFKEVFSTPYTLPKPVVFFNKFAGVCFGDVKYCLMNTKLPLDVKNLYLLPSQLFMLQQMTACLKLNWLILLNGPRLTGKSTMVEILAYLAGKELKKMKLNKETDASELLGAYEQVIDDEMLKTCSNKFMNLLENELEDIDVNLKEEILSELNEMNQIDIRTLRTKVDRVLALANNENSIESLTDISNKLSKIFLRFEWKNSMFVDAFKNGDWLLIEDVNCCSAAVLDRLNSCLESGGKLVLPESADGSIDEIEPHSDFRIFFTMDSKNGQLSRAMKNRSVEFCINEENSWYGDTSSALNVLLKNEKIMCATLREDEIKLVENQQNIIKKLLMTSTLKKITENERLNLLDENGRLIPSENKDIPNGNDRVWFVPNQLYVKRKPTILFDEKRQPRMPPIHAALYYCETSEKVTLSSLLTELTIQGFNRRSNFIGIINSCESITKEEYQLAGFCLSLLSTAPEAITKSRIMELVFLLLDKEMKEEMVEFIKKLFKENMDLSTPWDIRFYQTSRKMMTNENDLKLLNFMKLWLKNEVKAINMRKMDISPLSISNKFKTHDNSDEHLVEYQYLAPMCKSMIELFSTIDFEQENIDEKKNREVLNFIFDLATLIHTASMTNKDVHPLLVLRQCFHNLELEKFNAKDHEVWKILSKLFRQNGTKMKIFENFIRSFGIFQAVNTEKYLKILSEVHPVLPFKNEDAYMNVKMLAETLFESRKRIKKDQERITLNKLVDGLASYLKSYVVLKKNDLSRQNWMEFSNISLFATELISLFYFQNLEDKNYALFMSLLNSKFGIQNICPTLTTYGMTTSEILIDIVCKFWHGFCFSTKSFSAIPINDLAMASEKITQYQSLIWTTRNIYRKYKNYLTEQFSNATDGILQNELRWDFIFNESNAIFKMLIPTKGMIDPGLNDLVKLSATQNKQKILELFTSFSNCFTDFSSHPILRFIHINFINGIKSIKQLERTIKRVYRKSHLRFDEFVTRCKDIFGRWEAVSDDYIVRRTPWSVNVAFHHVLQHLTRTNNMISLVNAFCEEYLFEFCDLPDLMTPIYCILQCILLVLHYQQYLCERFMKLREISNNYDFPMGKVYGQINPKRNIFDDNFQLIEFLLSGREGMMPMQFQSEIVSTIFGKKNVDQTIECEKTLAFEWLIKEWEKWHDGQKEKRDKMFIYKERGGSNENDDEDETMIDPEDLEIQAMLPNLETEDFEQDQVKKEIIPKISNILPNAEDICEMIKLYLEPEKYGKKSKSTNFLSTMWILDTFNHSDAMIDPNVETIDKMNFEDSTLVDQHLLTLKNFREILGSKPMGRIINVYTENDKAEVIRCADVMKKLQTKIGKIQEVIPEEANLKLISDTVESFLMLDCGVPQLKLANFVEKVLDKAELWQKVSPRQYKLTEELDELQQILLDWRKMQVQSWRHILESISTESYAIALVMGYPLIDTIVKWKNNLQQDWIIILPNFQAMLIDWIRSSTLVDYEARLLIADVLAKIVMNLYGNHSMFKDLAKNILSIKFYFETYREEVKEKLQNKRKDAVQSLENFVNIVKFHDLNLWSVKNSAEKAHSKLFRIIKNYKLEGNEQLQTLFTEFLPTANPPPTIDVTMKPTEFVVEDRLIFVNFFANFSEVWLSFPGLHDAEDLYEFCEKFQELLKKDIIYNGEDDEANEKLQGKALFERQKKFSTLMKNSSNFGFRSRRAQQITSEELLKSSLTLDYKESSLDEETLRNCAVIRNVVMSLVNQLNPNKQQHILKQVTIQMITHIRGLTEFGFSWLSNVVTTFKKFNQNIQTIKTLKEKMEIYFNIAKTGFGCFAVSKDVKDFYMDVSAYSEQMKNMVEIIVELINSAPENGPNIDNGNEITQILWNESLHKQNPDYSEVTKQAMELFHLTTNMDQLCKEFKTKVVHDIWIPHEVQSFVQEIRSSAGNIIDFLVETKLEKHFEHKLSELRELMTNMGETLKNPPIYIQPNRGTTLRIESDVFQRKIQQIYKSVDSKMDLQESPIDILKKVLIGLTAGIDFSTEIVSIETLFEQLNQGYDCTMKNLERYTRLTTELYETLELSRSILSQFVNWTANYYIKLGHVNVQLLKKGLVNPIPKKEEGEGGQGNETQDVEGDNCGMGEGQGKKDVGNEIDETGQVDDLKNDNDENDNGQEKQNEEKKKDSETPLDMEDDFAADLENLDKDDNDDDDKNQDNEEEENQNEDWDMGNVDEPEENQIDPLLWDKPKENEQDKNLDDETNGADDKTEELAAKENDDIVARENEDKNDDEQENEEENNGDEEKEDENVDLENSNQVETNEEENNEEIPQPDKIGEMEESEDENDKEIEEQGDKPEENIEEGDKNEEEEKNDEENNGQIENMDVEEGAEPEECADKSNQGQSTGDEQKKKNSSGGNDEEQEKEIDEAEQNDNTKEDENSGKNDMQKSKSLSSNIEARKEVDKNVDDENDEETIGENQHLQPENDEEQMEIEQVNDDIEEAMETDEIDPESRQYAHIADDKRDSRDLHVIQKSTLEEALSTKSQYEKMKPNYDKDAVPNGENDETEEVTIVQPEKDFTLTEEEKHETMIHISTDFYELSKQSLRKLTEYEAETELSSANPDDIRLAAALSDSVSLMASELAENLRQIMEPSIANRLQGDYRTGKRLNMRRLVSYIASDYRKNRIWLRRTKKQQRNFQIMIAIDDSGSMGDNRMDEITCQSVCLIEKAFRQLEIGQLAICKFGQKVQMLREFTNATDAQDTLIASLLANLKFDQKNTDLLGLLSFANESFEDARQNTSTSSIPVQMLVIIGDGHGVFGQGKDPLVDALKEMESQRITVLYVIVDGKNSVTKMSYTTFENGVPKLTPYISVFPFPFYALVRTVSTLPGTLAEAIRQWVEMAMND